MADEIKPVMSPDEWGEALERLRTPDLPRMYAYEPLGDAQVMALANAALPDGHPNKITREDVDALATAMNELRYLAQMVPGSGERLTIGLLRRKLSALLPPEDAR
jgi:hypothetical protein